MSPLLDAGIDMQLVQCQADWHCECMVTWASELFSVVLNLMFLPMIPPMKVFTVAFM